MPKTNKIIMCVVFALLGIGVIMVYSSSFFLAERSAPFSNGYFFFTKHLIWVFISVLAMMLIKEIPYQIWSKLNLVILIVMFALLIAVFIPGIGRSYFGAHRWVKFGPIGFQPAEFAKLGLIIFVASFISKNPDRMKDFKRGLLPLLLISGAVLGLIMLEPDIGTTIFLSGVCGILLFVSRVRLVHAVPILLLCSSIIVVVALTFFPHVADRFKTFLDPLADPAGKGYQINQALIGLGSGGFSGVGLGLSKQKLFYLPQQHTDFVMAIIGEETGFIGVLIIILLFMIFFWGGWQVFRKSGDTFGSFLSLGITLLITMQALLNIAVVTASVPTKGMGLPFISYGGSALFATMCGVGILLNIAKQNEEKVVSSQ